MNISTAMRHFTSIGLSAVLSTGIVASAYAAPGTLSDSPLFLTNYPQANIFFMLDDSGSMDWEIMVQGDSGRFRSNQPDGTNIAGNPIQQRVTAHSGSGDCTRGGYTGNTYVYGVEFGSNSYSDDGSDCNTADDQAWRFRNADFNPLYFDPSKDYTPWKGDDANGSPFADVAIASAPDDPYRQNYAANLSETINLTLHNSNWKNGGRDASTGLGFWFYTWTDDGDGLFENGEETGYRIATVTQAQITAAGWENPDGTTKTVTELQQDFANWFSYYRKREYVVKRAVSKLINDSQVRVGISSLHNHNSIGTAITDVDDISTPINMTARTNKETLLEQLAKVNSSSGTPLRKGLRNVGRYFQVNASTSALFGTNVASPILSSANGGQCQQNFTILMSDGFWNSSSPSVGNTDQDGAGPYDGQSYADSFSDTLADVAMLYYERDLATGLANQVPVTAGVDDNDQQHMVTYTVAFGINGTTSCNPADRITSVASQNWPEVCTNPSAASGSGWPQPSSNNLETVDDMRHAAWNGRGLFLSASSPQQLIDSMDEAVSDIGDRAGSAAAVSFNSTSLQTNTLVYQAKFDSAGWHGDLRAIELVTTANGAVVLGNEMWKAGGLLDARSLASSPRQIASYNGAQGIAFEWPVDYTSPTTSELSTAQINDLLVNAPFAATTITPSEITDNQAYGLTVVDYMGGDDSNEGTATGDFRERSGHRLGDIVHSGPFYVGPPNTPYPNLIEGSSNPYSTFASTWSSRAGRVYVGANDGMLHVFDSNGGSTAGQEVFAYIPGFLFSDQAGEGLHHQAEQGYVHDYQVDLSPVAADVFIPSGWTNAGWNTALIGAVRGGGKGVFVLDVTNPTNLTVANAASVVKMEFTHADLGYTFSDIQVGKMNNGKWAAIFGNGYNNTGDGTAKLFILYLDGTTPHIISTGVGTIANGNCTDPGSDCNGMSTPVIADINGNGTIDRIYAGDLKGNMWVFNVPATTLTSSTSSVTQPLFIACEGSAACTSNNRQPITSKPTLARHPTQRSASTYPNIMVYFGTGQYLTLGDNSATQLQEFYGVWDRGDTLLQSDDLIEQTITLTTTTVASQTIDVRTMSNNAINYSTDHGWRIELPTSKERNVVAPVALGDVVFFNTMIPETNICSQGGYGWLMAVDQYDGSEPTFVVVDVNNDGVFDSADTAAGVNVSGTKSDGISTESRFLPAGSERMVRVTSDSTGGIDVTGVHTGPSDPGGRMSWTLLEY